MSEFYSIEDHDQVSGLDRIHLAGSGRSPGFHLAEGAHTLTQAPVLGLGGPGQGLLTTVLPPAAPGTRA